MAYGVVPSRFAKRFAPFGLFAFSAFLLLSACAPPPDAPAPTAVPPTTTPAELAVPKSGEAITIELTRPGYSPRKEQVVPNMSQRLVLPLTPLPRTGPAKPQEIPKFR